MFLNLQPFCFRAGSWGKRGAALALLRVGAAPSGSQGDPGLRASSADLIAPCPAPRFPPPEV